VGTIAGNYLIIAQRDKDVFVALVHLRPAPFASPREEVTTGQPVANYGSSGNSTQPHVQMEVMGRPVDRPRRPNGVSTLPRMASRRAASPDQGARPSGRGCGRRTVATTGGGRRGHIRSALRVYRERTHKRSFLHASV